jgi:hypothetical protein
MAVKPPASEATPKTTWATFKIMSDMSLKFFSKAKGTKNRRRKFGMAGT